MDNVKKDDVIVSGEVRELVLARLEDLIWICRLYPNDARGTVTGAHDIHDLITFGYTVEE